jgi:hypothetical protein
VYPTEIVDVRFGRSYSLRCNGVTRSESTLTCSVPHASTFVVLTQPDVTGEAKCYWTGTHRRNRWERQNEHRRRAVNSFTHMISTHVTGARKSPLAHSWPVLVMPKPMRFIVRVSVSASSTPSSIKKYIILNGIPSLSKEVNGSA